MKNILLVIMIIMSLSAICQNQMLDNFCGKWEQFAYKAHSDSNQRILIEDCEKKKIEFYKDGKYEDEMFSLVGIGTWQFNSDSSRIGYNLTEYMGQRLPKSDLPVSYNSIILYLSPDTLIIGHEAYFGPEKIKGHDDSYFVKIKK